MKTINEQIEQFKKMQNQLELITALCEQDIGSGEERERQIKGYYDEINSLFKGEKDLVYKVLHNCKEIFNKDNSSANLLINELQLSRTLKELDKNILGKHIEKGIMERQQNGLEISQEEKKFLNVVKESLKKDIDFMNEYRKENEERTGNYSNKKDVETFKEYLNEMEENIDEQLNLTKLNSQITNNLLESDEEELGDVKQDNDITNKTNRRKRSSVIAVFKLIRVRSKQRVERLINELVDETHGLAQTLLEESKEKIQEGRELLSIEEPKKDVQKTIEKIKEKSEDHNKKMPLMSNRGRMVKSKSSPIATKDME